MFNLKIPQFFLRQLFLSDVLQKNQFRYGHNGNFLFQTAQVTAEIYIETIKHNTDVRFYKSIIANKSVYQVYETDRKYKDAMVKTTQGSMVYLTKKCIIEGQRLKFVAF